MNRLSVQEALDYCLVNPDGLSREELLARFPEYKEGLEPLLEVAVSVRAIEPPPLPAERRAAMKARIVAAATASLPASTVSASSPAPVPSTAPEAARRAAEPWWRSWLVPLLRKPAFVVSATFLVLLLGVWWLSAISLPDSPFYQVKLASENFMLNFAGSPADRAREHFDIANERLDDVRALYREGKLAQVEAAIQSYNYHLENGTELAQETDGQLDDLITETAGKTVSLLTTIDGSVGDLSAPTKQAIEQMYTDVDDALQVVGKYRPPTPGGSDATPTPVAQADSQPIAVDARPSVTPGSQATAAATIAAGPHASATPPGPVPPTVTRPPAPTPPGLSTVTPGPRSTHTVIVPDPTRRPTHVPTPVRGRPSITPGPQHTPVPRATHTPRPAPTRAPGKPVCVLSIQSVDASCSPAGCASWTATVRNSGKTSISGTWTAQLQVIHAGGGFQTVATQTGSGTFPPGNTNVSGSFCDVFSSSDAAPARVIFTLDAGAQGCNLQTRSNTFAPCPSPPGATRQPTQEPPRPTRPAEPSRTPVPPRETATPIPTVTLSASTCTVAVDAVTATCGGSGQVDWSATVSNAGPPLIGVMWSAQLQVSKSGGDFQPTGPPQTGVQLFGSGTTLVSGRLTYEVPGNMTAVRVSFRLLGLAGNCNPQAYSDAIDPCPGP